MSSSPVAAPSRLRSAAAFFATLVLSDAVDFPMQRARQEITRGALRDLGVLP